ncbi:MAG: anti-sigma factor [Hyphomicrobium sp.]
MTERDDIDMLAAEFALGTLDSAERADVAARRIVEPALDRAIDEWDRRLAPLADTIAPVEPTADLLPRIEARIAARGIGHDATQASTSQPRSTSTDVVSLERRLSRWRRAAVAASALAASLVLAVGVREARRPVLPKTFVAVMQKDDASPSFLVTVDLEAKLLTVRPVAAERAPGKSYQLWMAHESFQGPRSLGLVGDADLTPRATLAAFDRRVIEKATFAVSLEPEGGSPIDRPTGPVLFHAKLVQVID